MKKVGPAQLGFMIYGLVCAGAYGLEPMVSESGPGITLVVLLLMPFLFSVPIALVSAELTAKYPESGGSVGWVNASLGRFWSFQAGWWTWLANLVAFSSYIVLFNAYLAYWFPDAGRWDLYILALALIWGLTLLNHYGMRIVGDSSVILGLLLLLPFVAIIIYGIIDWQMNPFEPFRNLEMDSGSAWLASIAWGVWLYSGYERLSVTGGEVKDPKKNFPKALIFAVMLAALSYFLPTLIALGSAQDPNEWSLWTDGYFTDIAARYGFGWLMVTGALISNILIANVTLLSNSRYPGAMADNGLLPKLFSRTNEKWGTPTFTLIATSVVYSLLALMSFEDLIYAYAWVCVGAYVLLYIAGYALRKKEEKNYSGYKVGIPDWGILLFGLPTIIIGLVGGILYFDLSYTGVIMLISGPALYYLLKIFKN